MNSVAKRRPIFQSIMGGTLAYDRTKADGTTVPVSCTYQPEPLHEALAQRALAELTEPDGPGFFAKADLLTALTQERPDLTYAISALEAANAIHWDFIVRWLAEQYGAELIPLAQHFFATHTNPRTGKRDRPLCDQIKAAQDAGDAETETVLAGRALASGYGKKTAGWASARLSNRGLVVKRLSHKVARAKGTDTAAQVALSDATKMRVPVSIKEWAGNAARVEKGA